jgi:predicted transcriptional regulator
MPYKYILRYCQYQTIPFICQKRQVIIMENINLLIKKGASCTDLLTCLYNLKPTDLEVLMVVAKNEDYTLDQIAKIVQKDRSSVHRCLSKLVTAGLVQKKAKTLKGGGYYHTYAIQDPEIIKKHAQNRVQEIIESLQSLIDGFESDLKRHLEYG